jgi:CHASE3 domain sensor protein
MSSHIINASSVQTQFSALANDKERLRSMEASAQQQRKMEESNLEKLKKEQSALYDSICKAHTELGVKKKRHQYLVSDKETLTRKIAEENNEMKQVIERIHNLEAEENTMKTEYSKNMEAANDEMLMLMRKVGDKKLLQLITTSTCKELIHVISTQNNFFLQPDREDNNEPEYIDPGKTLESLVVQKEVYYEKLRESCNHLIEAEETLHWVKQEEQKLQEKWEELRRSCFKSQCFSDDQVCI